jgi:hypothetical protein
MIVPAEEQDRAGLALMGLSIGVARRDEFRI